jgi:hypothetical protein
MPYDTLLLMSGTSGAEGTTLTTNANGATVYVGKNRVVHADLRATGTIGGTTGTLTLAIVEQSTSSGTVFQTCGVFPNLTSVMVGTTVMAANEVAPSTITFRTTRDWLRFSATLSSTASASGIEVRLRPSGETVLTGGMPTT